MILPIYNAERTLNRAIDSIIAQTIGFKNIELILIDDKSTDKSPEIIKQYLHYDNVKPIFLKENSGSPSKPRNIAIKKVTAPYLMFMDNDDKLSPDYCETLYNAIIEENVDIITCGYSYNFLDGVYAKPTSSKKRIEFKQITHSGGPMWASIFKTKFVQDNDIKCPYTLSEDGYFTIVAYTKANKVIRLPEYYGYIHTVESEGAQSLGHTSKIETFDKVIAGYDLTIDYLEKNKYNAEILFNGKIPRLYLVFFKFDANKEQKIVALKKIRNFQLSHNYPIIIKSRIYKVLNYFLLKEKYNIVLFLSSIATRIYGNRKLKNIIFKKSLNLKKVKDP